MVPTSDRGSVRTAFSLLAGQGDEPDEISFGGALLWLRVWGIWSEEMDDVGMELLHGLRRGDPRAGDVAAAPAHLFGPNEIVLARAAASIPLLFQWDAYLIPADGSLVHFISHDGYVDIQARTMDVHLRELERYRGGGWPIEPREI